MKYKQNHFAANSTQTRRLMHFFILFCVKQLFFLINSWPYHLFLCFILYSTLASGSGNKIDWHQYRVSPTSSEFRFESRIVVDNTHVSQPLCFAQLFLLPAMSLIIIFVYNIHINELDMFSRKNMRIEYFLYITLLSHAQFSTLILLFIFTGLQPFLFIFSSIPVSKFMLGNFFDIDRKVCQTCVQAIIYQNVHVPTIFTRVASVCAIFTTEVEYWNAANVCPGFNPPPPSPQIAVCKHSRTWFFGQFP